MLMRFDPFRELDRFSQQLHGARSSTPIDAYRHGDTFTVLVDLPGVDPGADRRDRREERRLDQGGAEVDAGRGR